MKKIISVFKFVLFLGIGLWIFYYLYATQEANYIARCAQNGTSTEDCNFLNKIINDFKNVDLWYIFLMWFAFIISNISRAYRWKMLLEPLGYGMKLLNGFFAIMLGYLANLGFPRMGEFVRAGTLAKYENKDAVKVMGTIVTDRIFDVLSLLIVICIALFFNFDLLWWVIEPGLEKFSFLTSPLFIILMLALIAGGIFFLRSPKTSNIPVFGKVKEIIFKLLEGVLSIRKLKNIPAFIFHSITIWSMYYFMTYCGLKAFHVTANLGPNEALMTFVFGSLGMVVPINGGIGAYHALVMQAVSLYGISGEDGFSLANILFLSIQILANLVFGLMALIVLPIINKSNTNEVDTQ